MHPYTEVAGGRRATTTWSGSRCATCGPARPAPVDASWLFIFIGAEPRTDWLDGVVARDGAGLRRSPARTCSPSGQPPAGWTLPRDPYHLETSVPGVFAAGDVRADSVKRVASAVGEGAMAVSLVHRYLEAQ